METTQDWIVHNFTNSVCSKLKLCLLLKCSRLNMCQNHLYSNYAEIFITQNVVKMFKLGNQTNLGLPDPTNSFWSLP